MTRSPRIPALPTALASHAGWCALALVASLLCGFILASNTAGVAGGVQSQWRSSAEVAHFLPEHVTHKLKRDHDRRWRSWSNGDGDFDDDTSWSAHDAVSPPLTSTTLTEAVLPEPRPRTTVHHPQAARAPPLS